MLKQSLTFTDYNDVERTEDYYFNITRAELIELEVSVNQGYSEMLTEIIQSEDSRKIYATFKAIVLKAYGIKTHDGARFEKSEELSEMFEQSPAYDILITKFFTEEGFASKWISSIVPADMRDEVMAGAAKAVEDVQLPETVSVAQVAAAVAPETALAERADPQAPEAAQGKDDWRSYSRAELVAMPQEQFDRIAGKDAKSMDHDLLTIAFERKS